MSSSAKALAYKALSLISFPHKVHNLVNKGKLTILMYHGITASPCQFPDWCMIDAQSFRKQIKYLNKHFDIVSLQDACNKLANGQLKKPTAVITFDDGYQNNFDYAFPILKEENAPAVIFLTTKFIDSDSSIWTGLLTNAFSITEENTLTWKNIKHDISTLDKKQNCLAKLKTQLKNLPLSAIENEVEIIISNLTKAGIPRIEQSSPYRILDTGSIRNMAESGLIEFAAHTHSHPILSQLTKEEQQREISQSIQRVAEISGKPCDYFAYPNGTINDYNDTTLSILENIAVKAALTTTTGDNDHLTPVMELRRFGIGSDMDMATFKLTIHNVLNRLKNTLN